jgi:beta-galactosidase
MDCPPAFQLSHWADVRLSRGDQGSFLFINNYQDDPVETTVDYQQQPLLGGHPVHLPARQGVILPIDWRLRPGLTVNYLTSEVVGVVDDGATLTLQTARDTFVAELTLSGYQCDQATPLGDTAAGQRVRVTGAEGQIVLRPV